MTDKPQTKSPTEYLVIWSIDAATEADTPRAAAEDALRTMNDARAGHPDGAVFFEVFDPDTGDRHTIDLAIEDGVDDTMIEAWPRTGATGRIEKFDRARLEQLYRSSRNFAAGGRATISTYIETGDFNALFGDPMLPNMITAGAISPALNNLLDIDPPEITDVAGSRVHFTIGFRLSQAGKNLFSPDHRKHRSAL